MKNIVTIFDDTISNLLNRGKRSQAGLMVAAAILGVLSGYAAIGFYLAIDTVLLISFGRGEANLATGARGLPWWQVMAVTTFGGILVGLIVHRLKRRQIKGVADVIESAALQNGRMPVRDGFWSGMATIIGLGTGSSTGREGPVVHLSASLTHWLFGRFNLKPEVSRTLLGCGVAAGVAASFNAPIAGVFFALEVIVGHYALTTFAPIVVAAVAGTLVSRAYLGDFPAFTVLNHINPSILEFPAFMFLGALAALVAVVLMRSLLTLHAWRTIAVDPRIAPGFQPVIGGVITGALAIKFPEILSVGYEATSRALDGNLSLTLMLMLIPIKIVALLAAVTLRYGNGVFSPSLFLGAMVGGSFGILMGGVLPDFASSPGLYAIVGMGALASAVLGAPISTSLIIFEITANYGVSIAVMTAAAVASLLTSLMGWKSFFHGQLAARGVHLESGLASYLLRSEKVATKMVRDFMTVQETTPLAEARGHLIAQGGGALVITTDDGHVTGILSMSDLPTGKMADETADEPIATCISRCPTLLSSDPLEIALDALEDSGADMLPVLSPTNGCAVGVLYHRDVMQAYTEALLESQGQSLRRKR